MSWGGSLKVLTYEAVNLLHKKAYGGNIDIAKAFDTLEWSFLLKVLKDFGFNLTFCNWIEVILNSANGKQHDFCKCTRGVRQGDPLSFFFFCLDEDDWNRGINILFFKARWNAHQRYKKLTCAISHTLCWQCDDILQREKVLPSDS